MKWLVPAGVLAIGIAVAIAWRRDASREPAPMEKGDETRAAETSGPRGETRPGPSLPAESKPALTPAEKAARIARIRADYQAIRKGVADELAAVEAAGAAGPGPFTETRVFLRRLVLLQREERADLARVLDAAELEEIELRESPAGQLVAQRLGGTAATEAQRRAVFRIEREFDERFGFVFDLAKEALVERARLRKEADGKIRAVLGEELFRAWTGDAGR